MTPSPTHPYARAFDGQDPAGGAAELGPLPRWDLSALYAEPADAAIDADFEWADTESRRFAETFEGRLAALDGDALAGAISRFEAIQERLGRILSFMQLKHVEDMLSPERGKRMGDAQNRANEISTALVFFSLELNRIDDAVLEAKLAGSAALARYCPWLDVVRAARPHQLSDEVEKLLHDQSVAGAVAWVRLFDRTIAEMRFAPKAGDALSLEQTLTLLTQPDRDRRKQAAMALSEGFTEKRALFAHILNTLVKQKEIEDRWRAYPSPAAERHLRNQVEPEVVQALRDAVVASYPRISHRYYALKAKWLGLEQLDYWDRNAPLPAVDDRKIPWSEAQDTVLSAYAAFSPELAGVGRRFFDENWIDAPAAPGKAAGAFAHPTVTSAHPYLMLNYLGQSRDVMTLAHELGHGVHQVLAAGQGELLSRTPLTLAETASVFGEMLTFKSLLAAETDPKRRKALLAGKVDDMINTVVRQIAFYEFETKLHAARRGGELTPDAIDDLWMSVQADSLGPAIRLEDSYRPFWSYVLHFYHVPFYVYAYAFGDGLVNALYAVYEEARAAGDTSFEGAYLEMLRAGGAKRHKELLAPFGLDASDPAFWSRGLGVIEEMIDTLEAMGD